MWFINIFFFIGLSIACSLNTDSRALETKLISEKNLTSFSSFDKNLKYFIANKLHSISDSLHYGKIIPSFSVQPNEGERLQVLARANFERIIKIRGSQTHGRIMIMEGEILVGEGPPTHIHHCEDVYFHVLKGELEIEVGDHNIFWEQLTHGFGARLQFVFQPAGIEHYFEEVSKVIVAQQPDWQNQAAAVAEKYEIELLGRPDWAG
ncbi:unnamed protein product [Rotaria socialis]|uniref:Cupin 2 conserved barrel domain-containing protein n=1 Tax=Rotaria socialis TaxID=392032 RepID=A0A818UDH3_9BILA|nr:unnamed protein product [Rotaria socialis]CAF3699086.1 unnamed protein product [Rotaria socialis]CAF4584485.1 unnamed protein product [Rotaria socialis]CAF4595715.1 unnamed protein product [Rotaria socialis]